MESELVHPATIHWQHVSFFFLVVEANNKHHIKSGEAQCRPVVYFTKDKHCSCWVQVAIWPSQKEFTGMQACIEPWYLMKSAHDFYVGFYSCWQFGLSTALLVRSEPNVVCKTCLHFVSCFLLPCSGSSFACTVCSFINLLTGIWKLSFHTA